MRKRDRAADPIELGFLMDWAMLISASLVAGIALHLALRFAGLLWTWSLLPLAVMPALWLVAPRAGLAIACAAGAATTVGFAWHQHDLERRGIEAQRARERLGPLAWIRGLWVARKAGAEPVSGARLALGRTPSGRIVRIPFGSEQGVRGLIVGAPGSGKTVTTAAIAAAYAGQGMPVVCVDPKGDPSLRDRLAEAAAASATRFVEWSPEGPGVYNPLGRGGATELADKALAGELWTEPHYLRQAQRYLGWATRALAESGETVSISSVARHLDPSALEALSDRMDEPGATELRAYLDSLSARQLAELGGVRDRLAVLAESELGPWLDPAAGEAIDLARAWRESWVLYFRLDSDRFPLASQMLGAAIVSDLVSLTGQLQQRAGLGLVAIDEFAAVGARNVLRVLSRSRSAGISVVLATQGLADLDDSGTGTEGGGFARRVLTQLDYLIAHRQPEPESAQTLASVTGTRPVWVTTRRVDSRLSDPKDATGSRTREREFVRHPDEFKTLRTGEAIIVEPAGSGLAQRVLIWSRTGLGGVPGTGANLPGSR